MGFLWDIIQHQQINEQRTRSSDLEYRVTELEQELFRTRRALVEVILRLEAHLGIDIDQDGRVGLKP